MYRVFVLVLVSCAPALLCAAGGSGSGPSDGAKGMPGATGIIIFQPEDWMGTCENLVPPGPTTWWVDSDGIAPGVAGCHVGTDAHGEENDRWFGEACLGSGLLVESNPGAGELHSHSNDVGHPDTFDCRLWCRGMGHDDGGCEMVEGPDPCEESARCTCG